MRDSVSSIGTVERLANVSLPGVAKSTQRTFVLTSASIPLILVQLLLLIGLVYKYSIENTAFLHVLEIASIGFVIQLFLPERWRLKWFVAVSLICIAVIVGQEGLEWNLRVGLARTGYLLGIGGLLIGACHLPISYWARAAVLIALGSLAAVFRSQILPAPALDPIWPILGSMFMFRLIVYLYDVSHEPKRPTITQSLAYFFLLPNVCFPLFPVIDFKTFVRGHFDGEPRRIYQKGLSWMLRGILQLMLYRLVYYHVAVDPAKMANGTDLIRYLMAAMFIYVRVSGQFHLAIGLLHLYGFNLPETNRNYFLASSFTDYWRRVNVYWKDFILKIFYYPAYFRLKKLGPTRAMVLATVFSFVATWLLHSYQWYWLRRQFPITVQDMIFWGVLCTLVIANVWWEMNHVRKRTLGKKRVTLRNRLGLALRVAGTFCVLTLLWSLWTCDSLKEWLSIWKVADWRMFAYGALILLGIMLASLTLDRDVSLWAQLVNPRATTSFPARYAVAGVIVPVVLLLLIGTRWTPAPFSGRVGEWVESMATSKPNARDSAKMQRAYYENLMDVGRFNPALWDIYTQRPANWKELNDTNVIRRTNDFLGAELLPNQSEVINGVVFKTNRWGMHDRDYTLEKPVGVHRTALLGASHLLGYDIAYEDDFDYLVEQSLNAGLPPEKPKYELLNFGVYYYSSLRQLIVLDRRVMPFQPDVVMICVHANDQVWTVEHIADAVSRGIEMPFPYLTDIVRDAKVDRSMPLSEIKRQLEPFAPAVVKWTYRQLVQRCRQAGIKPVFVYLPLLGSSSVDTNSDFSQWAIEAGFTVIDLRSAIAGHDQRELVVASWDFHPNVIAHRLLADKLYAALLSHPELGYSAPSSKAPKP